jgi:D-alanine-D-alanine ligase
MTFDLAGERPLGPADPLDRDAELDAPATIDAIAAALSASGYEVVRIGNLHALVARLASSPLGVEVVFNIAEGTRGLGREAQVPVLLEAYGVPYSGADPVALALTLDKGLCKRIWADAGLPTAPFRVVAGEGDLATLEFEYPAFVKPNGEGSSLGIDRDARVDDRAALEARVRRLWRDYRQPVLVEPYLPGPEFTIGILEREGAPQVLGMLQTAESGGMRSQMDKRASLTGAVAAPFVAVDDPALAADLADLALRAYRTVGGRDFARIDVRRDANGVDQLLEINLLPGLVPGRSPLTLIAAAAGITYPSLISGMLAGALRRRAHLEEMP